MSENEGKTLAEIIHAKLSKEETFAIKAKMDLNNYEFSKNPKEGSEGLFMDMSHVEGFGKFDHKMFKETEEKGIKLAIHIKTLRKVLLSFLRNGEEIITLIFAKDSALILKGDEELGIGYAIAPRIEEDES